jgi:monovalent cation/proton antiporter MnhG/PhaG subunit
VTLRDFIVYVLLALGVGAELVCCVGVLVMRNAFDRLHYAAAATTLGPFLIGAAVLVRESVSAAGLETIAVVAVLLLHNPVVEIATARAARRIEYGRIGALARERVE